MQLLARPPRDPSLAPFVQCLWYCERDGPVAAERILPTGGMQLILDLTARPGSSTAAVLVGPQTGPLIISTASMRRAAGVAWRIGGAGAFLPCPASTMRDRTDDLAGLWGRDAERLWTYVGEATSAGRILDRLERALTSRLRMADQSALALDPAIGRLARGNSVAETVDHSGLTRSTFRRRFEAAVGLSPKGWSGLARFQRATRLLASGHDDLAEVALNTGYADQAHMTRAFQRYAGVTPGAYRPLSADEPNHLEI